MKQTLIIVLLLLLLCAVTLIFIHELLSPAPGSKVNVPAQDYNATSGDQITSTTAATSTPSVVDQNASTSASGQGDPSNGPFAVMDAKGNDSGATLGILRSPEEVLIQFKDFTQTYPDGSRLYLASDPHAKSFVDLGPARLNYGVYLYDIPMDANTHTYPYIGIFSTTTDTFSYYAKIQ